MNKFVKFWILVGLGASEGQKIKFFLVRSKDFLIWNLISLTSTVSNLMSLFLNLSVIFKTLTNKEVEINKKSKFLKFSSTPEFYYFFWLKKHPYLNFWHWNDWITSTLFFDLLSPLALPNFKIWQIHLTRIYFHAKNY